MTTRPWALYDDHWLRRTSCCLSSACSRRRSVTSNEHRAPRLKRDVRRHLGLGRLEITHERLRVGDSGNRPWSAADGSREAVAIEAAKKAIVRQIDPALPRTTFETWLRGLVGAQSGYQVGSERLRGADRQSQRGSGAGLPDVRAGPGLAWAAIGTLLVVGGRDVAEGCEDGAASFLFRVSHRVWRSAEVDQELGEVPAMIRSRSAGVAAAPANKRLHPTAARNDESRSRRADVDMAGRSEV